MSIVTSIANLATKPMPKMVPAKGHAWADSLVTGAFMLAGLVYWRRNKRASLAAFACGGTHLATSLLTSYDRRKAKPINLRLHRDMDLGMAAMVAAMPGFLQFEEDRQKKFFLLQATALTALANLPDFEQAMKGSSKIDSRAA